MNRRLALFDVHVPFQRVRHSSLAQRARQALYYLAIGKEGYPFVFNHVAEGDETPYPTSPNLYVHIPFCRSICAHCPYNKIVYREASYRAYATAIERELAQYLARPDVPPIQTLYFGGGTPSMTPDLIERIIAMTRDRFAEEVEIGVEAHPHDATPEHLAQLKRAGVNRISLGIETFQEELLRILGRNYTRTEAEEAIQNARQAGFDCVDVNMIYGIPGQRRADAVADVNHCIALGVDHLSAYPLITFEHTHLGKLVAEGRIREYGDRARVPSATSPAPV